MHRAPVLAGAIVPRQPAIELRNVYFDRFELQDQNQIRNFTVMCNSVNKKINNKISLKCTN